MAQDRFTATILKDGIETNRTTGKLTDRELEAIDSLRKAGKIVERHGQSPLGLKVKLIPCPTR